VRTVSKPKKRNEVRTDSDNLSIHVVDKVSDTAGEGEISANNPSAVNEHVIHIGDEDG
jgi:hypothetical protein